MQMEKASSYCIFIVAEIKIKASQCYHHLRKKLFTLLINTLIPFARRSDTNIRPHLGKIKVRVESVSSEEIKKKIRIVRFGSPESCGGHLFSICSMFSIQLHESKGHLIFFRTPHYMQ